MANVVVPPQPATSEFRPLRCPKCAARLEATLMGPIEIDCCVGCGGIFLDRGELDAITWAERTRLLGQILGRGRAR
jgi:Zn-finger nucleic acid-binding protein